MNVSLIDGHIDVPKDRNLDGCYFRVKRNGKWDSVCFSDLTEVERQNVLDGRNEEWLKSLCCHLADTIRNIGEEFDIRGGF